MKATRFARTDGAPGIDRGGSCATQQAEERAHCGGDVVRRSAARWRSVSPALASLCSPDVIAKALERTQRKGPENRKYLGSKFLS
jgi:hypothetical protein